QFARAAFTIRSLVGVVAVTVILVGGAIVLLRHRAPTTSLLPPRPNQGGVIMEGVNINSNGAGVLERDQGGVIMEGVDINSKRSRASERKHHSSPRELFPP